MLGKKTQSNIDQTDISPEIRKLAPSILEEIKKAKSILLHCHPSPDPDSVGSALAMKLALEQLGKKAVVIGGDNKIPEGFMHFPGADKVIANNFIETALADFDLFISLDSSSLDMISKKGIVIFPDSLKVIVIDHHVSNTRYGSINLVVSYPATTQIVFDLITLWNIRITKEIASNLFIGLYTDTGGFKFPGTNSKTFKVAAELSKIAPDYPLIISKMENSFSFPYIRLVGKVLSNVEGLCDGKVGFSMVSFKDLKEIDIDQNEITLNDASAFMRAVKQFKFTCIAVETSPNNVKMSFRTNDSSMFDVAKFAGQFGGGGHKAASGATVNLPLEKVRDQVVARARELYNL